jgi:hypothetical protein
VVVSVVELFACVGSRDVALSDHGEFIEDSYVDDMGAKSWGIGIGVIDVYAFGGDGDVEALEGRTGFVVLSHAYTIGLVERHASSWQACAQCFGYWLCGCVDV